MTGSPLPGLARLRACLFGLSDRRGPVRYCPGVRAYQLVNHNRVKKNLMRFAFLSNQFAAVGDQLIEHLEKFRPSALLANLPTFGLALIIRLRRQRGIIEVVATHDVKTLFEGFSPQQLCMQSQSALPPRTAGQTLIFSATCRGLHLALAFSEFTH